ncbi:hypothetical protein COCON_G00228460 [Conger conger]|uniref:HMG box-containing protein 1 n=1 Tax=Conger conger TaxID=82655 RepID=A0A9Q1HJ66_CONCO|nr:hypothetical protein COCON_G00228460 [Conger conger]
MATVWSGEASRRNMVWKVKTAGSPDRVEEPHQGALQGAVRTAEAFNMLKCNTPSSLTLPSSESHVEYDDLPELQEAQEVEVSSEAFQVPVGVSHQERPRDTWRPGDLPDTNWLTELANIATSTQSPLLLSPARNRSSPVHISANSSSLHSYARPPLAAGNEPGPAPARSHWRERRRLRARSEWEPGASCRTSLWDEEDVGWSQSWPATAWLCFLKGTRVRFHGGRGAEWRDVEDLCESESEDEGETPGPARQGYGSEGLTLVAHEEVVSFGQSVLKLTFDPGSAGHDLLTAECSLGHPFYVKNKGWSSFHPSLTVVQHGIPCYEAQPGDVCLPPGHRDAVGSAHSLVFHTFRRFDFTPLDSSAVKARRRPSPGAASPATPTKCKRPMNAFMLFAKKYRVEYTQMYPGRDNRAISVILGDKWKKMKQEERRMFATEAKALAEEQKRLNPDCWKRRRTSSQGPQPN